MNIGYTPLVPNPPSGDGGFYRNNSGCSMRRSDGGAHTAGRAAHEGHFRKRRARRVSPFARLPNAARSRCHKRKLQFTAIVRRTISVLDSRHASVASGKRLMPLDDTPNSRNSGHDDLRRPKWALSAMSRRWPPSFTWLYSGRSRKAVQSAQVCSN